MKISCWCWSRYLYVSPVGGTDESRVSRGVPIAVYLLVLQWKSVFMYDLAE